MSSVLGGAGLAGEGGRDVDRETARMSSPGRQLDVPPPPAPPPRRCRLCLAERVSRERGDALSIAKPFACHRPNDNLMFPHPRPLPRDGVGCVGRSGSRGRGGTRCRSRNRSRAIAGTTTCCSPTPGPSPATMSAVLGRAGSAGEGGRDVDDGDARITSPERQLHVPPPPAPPPRRCRLCWAERVSRERGDGSGIWLAKFSLKSGTEHLTPPRRRFICTCDTRQPLVNRLTGHCHVDNTPCRSGSTFAGPG